MSKAQAAAAKKDQTHSAEMDRMVGPVGALALMIGLPIALQFIWFSCENYQCSVFPTVDQVRSVFATQGFQGIVDTFVPIPDTFALKFLVAWELIQFALHAIVPGRNFLGYPIFDKSRVYYRLNGLACFLITMAGVIAAQFYGYFDFAAVVPAFGRILTAFNLLAFGGALFLHVKGFLFNTGNPDKNTIVNYFYGYEPNPRIFGIVVTDFKFFWESRALILWVVFNFCLAMKQRAEMGEVALSMILVNVFQFIYVLHFFVVEENCLSMIDFIAENMGWMLTWGNVVWVPFLYCVQAWYIYRNPVAITHVYAGICVAVFLLGYTIFAQANTQKHAFKSNPQKPIWGEKPRFIPRPDNKNTGLLLSGWWGIGRHMNYTGDLLIALSFGLPTLFASAVPYAYFIFLTCLLLQRERRDDAWCKEKYGALWDEYCKQVPYRLIPYVY